MTLFAINPPDSEYEQALIAAWRSASAADVNLKLYALVDRAFDERWQPWADARLPEVHALSLYEGTQLSGVDEVAPHLLALPANPAMQEQYVGQIIRRCAGKPMLSLIASREPLQNLKTHFERYATVHTEDEQQFVLRYADVRILDPLISVLTESQVAAFLSPIKHWWTSDRMGQLVSLSSGTEASARKKTETEESSGPLILSEKQFAALIDAAEADALIEQLYRIIPEQCLEDAPGKLHRRVSEQLSHMERFGIHDMADRIAYCVGDFNTRAGLHDLEQARALIQMPDRQPGSLAQALASLPEECWAR